MSKVGDSISAENASWSFGGDVAKTFDDHVSKSVPFYLQGHDLVAKLSDFFLNNGSICYDIGCSTGTLLEALARRNKNKSINFLGIEPEAPMVARAKDRCSSYSNIEINQSDVLDVDMANADMIISFYTIQFIRPRHRQELFNRIYKALNWGGAFLWFEKVRAPDARFQDMMTLLYTDYKIDMGYDAQEIVGKSRSLKGVLEPFSTQANIDMAKRAGFEDIMSVFKYVCFEGFLAIK
jgi:tRNA (cmo5U34)-methyltransferase